MGLPMSTKERFTSSPSPTKQLEEEERENFLPGWPSSKDDLGTRPPSPRLKTIVIFFVIVLLGAAILRPFLIFSRRKTSKAVSRPEVFLSNGTHEYDNTVLLISIDGLRADYLDRGLTPHLLEISRSGLRAEWMKPSFPTLTFPNHWTLMTGLYPESHGIVANNFWDPNVQAEFYYSDPARSWNGSWWGGEPVWATAAKAGLKTANMMWPGPPMTGDRISPTYFVPFQDEVPLPSKLNKIIEWLELPKEERPRLITVYEPSVDEAGHLTGPDSILVNDTLVQVDIFARDLHKALADRHLTDIVDIIFVSDHGMVDTSNVRLVYLDEILGEDGVNAIEHQDGWPAIGLRFSEKANTTHLLSLLQKASEQRPEAFSVYTTETMPPRFHFTNNDRIAPIYVLPHLGWAITNHHEHVVVMGGDYKPKGNHGYDNDEPSMFASFIADGPFSQHLKRRRQAHQPRSGHTLSSLTQTRPDQGQSTTDSPYIIPGFRNVEIYGLVTKLLGIQEYAAPNNGTLGFWDQFF